MKIRTILVSMLAMFALASCNKGNETNVEESNADNAYIAISLNSIGAPGTYAGPTEEDGTAAESAVNDLIIVGFDDNEIVKGVYTYDGTDPVGQASEAIKVSPKVTKIFVIVNPTDKISAQVNASLTTYAGMNAVLTGAASLNSVDNAFVMTSAGTLGDDGETDDKGLTLVTPVEAVDESASAIQDAQDAAVAASVDVFVDRLVARATVAPFTASATNVENGTASVDGWLPNATNTKYMLYAALTPYSLDGSTTYVTDAKYRIDANYAEVGTAYETEFNWLDNNDNVPSATTPLAWITPSTTVYEYISENTMNAEAQNYNNTTKAIIKAQFAPTGVTLGDSWFRVGGIIYTFDELMALYNSSLPDSVAANPDLVEGFDAFATAVMGTTTTFGALTLTGIDAVENGGYKAATADPYMIEYYQNSICYYDVNIMHDNRVDAKLLGRWGVVRNNSYTLTVTKITKPGKPYIPDPTDPDITDPENPDPEDPEPNDESSAYISVTITVNPWTAWGQEVEL